VFEEYKEEFIPVLRAHNINETINYDKLVYVPPKYIKDIQYLQKGDILICMSSGSKNLVGKSAQIEKVIPTSFGTFCGVLRSFKPFDYKYIGYYFQTKSYRNYISEISSGININNLKSSQILEVIIPLPPLPEQHRIVAKLEELFSQLDSAVAALKKAKEQIKTYKQSVLAAAFSGKLTIDNSQLTINEETSLPEGWKWVIFSTLVNNFDGKRIPISKELRSKRQGRYRYYGATEIVDYIDDYIFDGKYLLIGEDGANLLSKSRNLAFIVEGQFWVNNHAHVLQTKDNCQIDFLCYYINSLDLKQYITGSAQPKLTQANMNRISVPIPPISEQQQIVSEIEARFSEAENLEKTIDTNLTQAESLRQSILKKAFEGRLVPQDPNDEPASVLLERIKQLKMDNGQLTMKKVKK
jgi:type I restriction enzyme, S subunit